MYALYNAYTHTEARVNDHTQGENTTGAATLAATEEGAPVAGFPPSTPLTTPSTPPTTWTSAVLCGAPPSTTGLGRPQPPLLFGLGPGPVGPAALTVLDAATGTSVIPEPRLRPGAAAAAGPALQMRRSLAMGVTTLAATKEKAPVAGFPPSTPLTTPEAAMA